MRGMVAELGWMRRTWGLVGSWVREEEMREGEERSAQWFRIHAGSELDPIPGDPIGLP